MNQNCKIFQETHCGHTYGLQVNHHQLKFWPSLIFFTAHSVCGKKPKNIKIRSQLIKKWIFWFSPQVNYPDGFTYSSAKNASEKFSCLGTFKSAVVDFAGV